MVPSTGFAQLAFLPKAGSMVELTPKFDPVLIKGIHFHPDNPFQFDFIVDTGDSLLTPEQAKAEGKKLVSYFLASLTTPEKQMWVNLSPYEKQRVIPTAFGQTEMGKELLAQDYLLKQIMATALYPEKKLGQEFWKRVYAQAAEKFGTTNLPVTTFNKVWILPDKATVYENSQMNAVFVVESSLKVLLEQDYLALKKHQTVTQSSASALSSKIIREVVIPALEKEVNEGKNFAPLRQIYQSLILAAWYKENLKDNVLSQAYVDRHKILGIDVRDKNISRKIYRQYLQAYRKGVYNFIREETDPATQIVIPRKYFSGGMVLRVTPLQASKAMVSGFTTKLLKSSVMVMSAGVVALTLWTGPAVAAKFTVDPVKSPGVVEAVVEKGGIENTLEKVMVNGAKQVGINIDAKTAFQQLVRKGKVQVLRDGKTVAITGSNYFTTVAHLQSGNNPDKVIIDYKSLMGESAPSAGPAASASAASAPAASAVAAQPVIAPAPDSVPSATAAPATMQVQIPVLLKQNETYAKVIKDYQSLPAAEKRYSVYKQSYESARKQFERNMEAIALAQAAESAKAPAAGASGPGGKPPSALEMEKIRVEDYRQSARIAGFALFQIQQQTADQRENVRKAKRSLALVQATANRDTEILTGLSGKEQQAYARLRQEEEALSELEKRLMAARSSAEEAQQDFKTEQAFLQRLNLRVYSAQMYGALKQAVINSFISVQSFLEATQDIQKAQANANKVYSEVNPQYRGQNLVDAEQALEKAGATVFRACFIGDPVQVKKSRDAYFKTLDRFYRDKKYNDENEAALVKILNALELERSRVVNLPIGSNKTAEEKEKIAELKRALDDTFAEIRSHDVTNWGDFWTKVNNHKVSYTVTVRELENLLEPWRLLPLNPQTARVKDNLQYTNQEVLLRFQMAMYIIRLFYPQANWVLKSDYRSEKENGEAGGKPNSRHLKGLALDIAVSGAPRSFVSHVIGAMGFWINPEGTHDHIDREDGFKGSAKPNLEAIVARLVSMGYGDKKTRLALGPVDRAMASFITDDINAITRAISDQERYIAKLLQAGAGGMEYLESIVKSRTDLDDQVIAEAERAVADLERKVQSARNVNLHTPEMDELLASRRRLLESMRKVRDFTHQRWAQPALSKQQAAQALLSGALRHLRQLKEELTRLNAQRKFVSQAPGQGSVATVSMADNAMAPGGIDLEKTNLTAQSDGRGVKTAFSDPAMLQMLRNSDGLAPVIYDVKPATVPMINMLLGLKEK